MPRAPRIDMPGLPQHLVMRGNNRTSCFFHDADRQTFLRFLAYASEKYRCDVHAFVLMTNHIHLLATGNRPAAVSRMMQSIGRRYARYVNETYERTGTLFEGRFHASLVESERYFLTCMQYIEMNPARCELARGPSDYPWSSHLLNVSGAPSGVLKAHAEYLRLGADSAQRGEAYRALFSTGLSESDLKAIRESAARNRALGSESFHKALEVTLRREVRIVGPGRPKRAEKSNLSLFQDEK
jgi:putative transposase